MREERGGVAEEGEEGEGRGRRRRRWRVEVENGKRNTGERDEDESTFLDTITRVTEESLSVEEIRTNLLAATLVRV